VKTLKIELYELFYNFKYFRYIALCIYERFPDLKMIDKCTEIISDKLHYYKKQKCHNFHQHVSIAGNAIYSPSELSVQNT